MPYSFSMPILNAFFEKAAHLPNAIPKAKHLNSQSLEPPNSQNLKPQNSQNSLDPSKAKPSRQTRTLPFQTESSRFGNLTFEFQTT